MRIKINEDKMLEAVGVKINEARKKLSFIENYEDNGLLKEIYIRLIALQTELDFVVREINKCESL